ncbi:MAG: hypothetical protein FWG73_05170 [Planctomycetaceae bacterium]|nr:hypothetical protein [Planctomycetaceae bacterium]
MVSAVIPPNRQNRITHFLLPAGLAVLCALAGCQSLPRSGFDPSGQRLFEHRPIADCPLFNRQRSSSPTTITSTPTSTPPQAIDPFETLGASTFTPSPNALPGSLGAARTHPAIPQQGSTATVLPPGTHSITTALLANPEAGPTPLFADSGGYALPTVPVAGPALIMTPREQIAPLGSEVILIASRLGNRDRLVTNEKIEWALEGVGLIEKIDTGSCRDLFFLDHVKARKVSERYAITKTSSSYQTLDRGTIDTTDDVHLLRGQTWVSVNSMREGTTHVTAFAPGMADWSKRTDVGIIHWVDAQWVLPRLAIAPVGESRILTTTVLRATNGQPRQGWIVRYEIQGGPDAAFQNLHGGSGSQVEEVETDASGQATAILNPLGHTAGTNTIAIQIIRPAGLDGDRRITVGSEVIRQTWSGSPNMLLNIRGPSEARLGQELHYEITAENRSASAMRGVVALPIPRLATYVRSESGGVLQESTVLWNMDLMPHSTASVHVVLRQDTAGSLWLRPEFRRTNQVVSSPMIEQPSSPALPSPSPVESGASVFPGAVPSPPPVLPSIPASPPTSPPAATTFAPRPSLSVQLEPHWETPVMLNNMFVLNANVTNTGTADVRNMMIVIPLPNEFRGQTILAGSEQLASDGTIERPKPDWTGDNDEVNHQVRLQVPVLAAGKTAQFQVKYPTIGLQGYEITCTVFVEGQQVAQGTRRIVP